jgi:hypothetical protein
MSALLTALSRLPAGHTELRPEQAAWLLAQLHAEGIAPQGVDAWPLWELECEDAIGSRVEARIALSALGTRGTVHLVRDGRHVDESEIEAPVKAELPIKNNNRAGAMALVHAAQALAARKGVRA